MHGTVHVHIADSVRAKLAVRITAPFADPCPFCPFIRAPGLIVWLVHAAHSCGPVLRRSTRAGRRAGLVRTCGRGRLPDWRHPIEAATEAVTECASPAAEWKTGTVPWRATLRGSGRWTGGGVMSQGFPVFSQGLDPVEPVMNLSWTGDVPVMQPPYACAGYAPDHGVARSARAGRRPGFMPGARHRPQRVRHRWRCPPASSAGPVWAWLRVMLPTLPWTG